jgi:hypothetical protein
MTLARLAASTSLALLAAAVPAVSGEAGDITRDALYAGDLAGGIEELAPMIAADDPEAEFGTGLITFVQGIEGFAYALYRHGLAAPETGPMGPALDVPVPVNPNPEPLDYQGVRAILQTLVTKMDEARAHLERGGESGDYVVLIDPLRVRVDANGDGTADETETIEGVFQRAFGMQGGEGLTPTTPPPAVTDAPRTGSGDRSGRLRAPTQPETQVAAPDALPDASIGLDRADAIWFAGYSQVVAAQADFFLAHDFEDFVNVSFHRLFPHAGFPMQEYATGGTLALDPETDTAIADAIAAVHTLNWPVTEPARLAGVLERFRSITALSRRNWEAILAETDDERELLPSPAQTSIVPEGRVTQEIVDAWMATLDTFDQILAGELLVPHWRFKQGFDLKAYFETATRTDLVMLMSGYDALPYIKDGPIATAESFAEANRVFGDQLMGYVFWFN